MHFKPCSDLLSELQGLSVTQVEFNPFHNTLVVHVGEEQLLYSPTRLALDELTDRIYGKIPILYHAVGTTASGVCPAEGNWIPIGDRVWALNRLANKPNPRPVVKPIPRPQQPTKPALSELKGVEKAVAVRAAARQMIRKWEAEDDDFLTEE